jgi:hypothetical protein
VDGEADARADEQAIADPPAEAGRGEMGLAARRDRAEGIRRRRSDEAQRPDTIPAPTELKIGPVLQAADA